MVLALRILHYLGNGLFISSILYITLLLNAHPQSASMLYLVSQIFYGLMVPGFIVGFVSGILLVVYRGYRFKAERWLKQKALFTLFMMFVIILVFFPEMRSIMRASDIPPMVPFRTNVFTLLSVLLMVVSLINLGIAFRHRGVYIDEENQDGKSPG